MTTTSSDPLTNLREVGGAGFQALSRPGRRVVFRANTEPGIGPDAYPPSVARVIDLRRDDEIDAVPHPLAFLAGYRSVPMFDPSSTLESDPAALRLEEQYDDWIVRHRQTIGEVFRALSDSGSRDETGAAADVLICCSAGKDRTGVVSALLARLWGADLERVGADYAVTGPNLAARFAGERAVSTDLETTSRMQRCVPETAVHVIERVESAYGSVAGYLRWLGLTDAQIGSL